MSDPRGLNFGARRLGGPSLRGTLFAPSDVRPLWGLLQQPDFSAQVFFDDLGRFRIGDLHEGEYVFIVRGTGAGGARWGCEARVNAGQFEFVLHLRPLGP